MTNIDTFTNFDSHVPYYVRKKISDIITAALDDDLLEDAIGGEVLGESDIEDISGVARSGYIPLQDGGFSIRVMFDAGYSSGASYTNDHDSYKNYMLLQYEMEYLFEEAVFGSLCVYVKGSNIVTQVRLAYKDAPYFREKYDEILVDFDTHTKDFLALSYEDFKKLVIDKLAEYKKLTENEEKE